MNEGRIEFRFGDGGADGGAAEFAQLLHRELPSGRVETRHQPAPMPAGDRRQIDLNTALTLAALVLTVPQAVKATLDLADRYQLQEKLARLIAWAKERRARRLRNPFVVLPPQGVKTPLHEARPEQLAAALTGSTGADKPPKP